jgi:hypothetical protein
MRFLKLSPRTTTIALTAILAAIFFAPGSIGAEGKAASPFDRSASLAAWNNIAAVLQNPRCLNCHQLDSPLQGDSRRVHMLYGWNPGKGRQPVPISHEKTVEYMKTWVAGGMECPQ